MIRDVLGKRLILDAQVIAINPKAAKAVYSQVDKYTELVLPYLAKKDTINTGPTNKLNTEEIAYWQNFRKERAKEREQNNVKDG